MWEEREGDYSEEMICFRLSSTLKWWLQWLWWQLTDIVNDDDRGLDETLVLKWTRKRKWSFYHLCTHCWWWFEMRIVGTKYDVHMRSLDDLTKGSFGNYAHVDHIGTIWSHLNRTCQNLGNSCISKSPQNLKIINKARFATLSCWWKEIYQVNNCLPPPPTLLLLQ